MGTSDDEGNLLFCFTSHFPNAHPTQVVFAASWYQNSVEIPQADRTAVLEDFLFFLRLGILILKENALLGSCGLYSDFVPQSQIARLSLNQSLLVWLVFNQGWCSIVMSSCSQLSLVVDLVSLSMQFFLSSHLLTLLWVILTIRGVAL